MVGAAVVGNADGEGVSMEFDIVGDLVGAGEGACVGVVFILLTTDAEADVVNVDELSKIS